MRVYAFVSPKLIGVKLARRNDNSYRTFFQKYIGRIKISPFNAELNSRSSKLISTDQTYFGKKISINFRFVVLAPSC